MHIVALLAALGGLVAVALPTPGLYIAVGAGITGLGLGLAVYRTRALTGAVRLAGAAAMALGAIALLLGVLRVVLVLLAIDRIESMLG